MLDFLSVLSNRPILIGMHLGFAIVGIDAFLWTLGELLAGVKNRMRILTSTFVGVAGFLLSWIMGGYYYVVYYGSEVKPGIKSGLAPWAHSVVMETKEHIFLFIIPLAVTAALIVLLDKEELDSNNLKKPAVWLVGLIVFIGLSVGAMGFIISAAARWG